jgi:hypothetical protein
MAADLNQGYNDANSQIQGLQTYNQVSSDLKNLQNTANSSGEAANSAISNSLSEVEQLKNKAQQQAQSQFDQMIKLITAKTGNGYDTTKYLKKTLIKTFRKIKPNIENIIVNEVVKTLGCSEQQEYETNQAIYLKVSSVDFINLLKNNPFTKIGSIKYEKQRDLTTAANKYPMNRQLYQRIVDQGLVYTFRGASGQDLFDISYEITNDLGQPGDYFKIVLKDRLNLDNKIADFIKDYYKRMNFVEYTNIFAILMDLILGAVSIQASAGLETVKDQSKFGLLIARILGLCFDNRKQIDVSGVAKVGELDNLDDSFFEFSQLDLLKIDQTIANIQNQSVELEGCDNIKFPVNSFEIVNALEELNKVDDNNDSDLLRAFDNLTNTFTNSAEGIGIGANINLKASFDFSIIKEIPKSLIFSLFTPKIFLPILIMLKASARTAQLEVNSMVDFAKIFKLFFVEVSSQIGSLFVKELFRILKKEITQLLQVIINDLKREKADATTIIILSLVKLLIQVAQIINDFRQCKSVLDQILALLEIPGLPSSVPLPLLFAAPLRSGFSANRALKNTIQELQKSGLPTGPLPDGSPNLGLIAAASSLKGSSKESQENGKIEFAIPPLAVGIVTTAPTKFSGIPI